MPDETWPHKTASVPLVYQDEGLETRFANQVVFQSGDDVFYLNFFEAHPPMFVGSQQEQEAQLEAMTSVTARGVVRIVLPKARISDIVNAINSLGSQMSPQVRDTTAEKGK